MTALYSIITRATGTTLTAAIYNSDHQNHVDNGIPAQLDDYSLNAAQMQSAISPGGVGSESLPTSLAGELERLRFVIKTMHGGVQWYPGQALNFGAAASFAGALILNGKIVRSVGSNALTVALKRLDGTDPSATNPVYVVVPSLTSNVFDGGYTIITVTAALSVIVSSGSTLGHTSAVASPVYVYLLNNAGALELAVSTKFFGLSVQTTTAEGGAGAADSSTVLYSTTLRSNVAVIPLQRWKSTQTTAGTWAATTGEVQLWPFPYKAPATVKITAAGANTYTAPWDMLDAEIKVTGGGAAGGGSAATGAGQVSIGSGGGSGGTAIVSVSAAVLTGNNTVTIGAKGTGVSGANGTAGGNSSVVNAAGVTLAAATGGAPGQALAAAAATGIVGGAPGIGTTGDILLLGNGGLASNGSFAASIFWAGYGGASYWGGGAMIGVNGSSGGAASSVNAYGAGGSGALTQPSAAANSGGPGTDGVYVITERY